MSEAKEKLIDFGKLLGAEAVEAWESACPDPGVQFLQGASTSVLSASGAALDSVAGSLDTVTDLIDGGSALVSAVQTVDYKQYAKVIKNAAIDAFNTQVVEYGKQRMQEAGQEIAAIGTTYFPQRITYWTATCSKVTLSDILADLMQPMDEKCLRAAEDSTKNGFADQMTGLSEKVGSVNSLLGSASDLALEGISESLSCLDAGPQYLESNLNKYLNLAIKPIQKEIDANLEAALEEGYKNADAAAEAIGRGIAEKTIGELKSKAQEKKADIDKVKITVVSFVKSALDLVKKMALALIGG